MNKLRDSRGSFVKNLVKPPHSPSSSSETSYETESSDTHSEPNNMENIGDPPPHNEQPHDNRQHDNPLYGNRTLKEYIYPLRITIPSCIMFPHNVQHQEFKLGMIQLLSTFHGLEKENPCPH